MSQTRIISPEELAAGRPFTDWVRAHYASLGVSPLAYIRSFGCQQNVADSQNIMGMLRAMGCELTDTAEQADIVVLNTCAIRDHAEKRVFGNLGVLTHTKKANPEQIICLCGEKGGISCCRSLCRAAVCAIIHC